MDVVLDDALGGEEVPMMDGLTVDSNGAVFAIQSWGRSV